MKEGFTKLTVEDSAEKIHLHALHNRRKTAKIRGLQHIALETHCPQQFSFGSGYQYVLGWHGVFQRD